MRYDLKQVEKVCTELGLRCRIVSEESTDRAEIDLGEQAVLCLVNAEHDRDCLIGFKGTDWHFHGDFVFEDRDRGLEIKLDYLEMLRRLENGQLVVLEHWSSGLLRSRELLHSDSATVLHHITAVQALEAGAEIRIWRAPRCGQGAA